MHSTLDLTCGRKRSSRGEGQILDPNLNLGPVVAEKIVSNLFFPVAYNGFVSSLEQMADFAQ